MRTKMLLSVTFCCLALFTLTHGDETPKIISVSKGQIKETNEEVELNCTVKVNEDSSVLWVKKSKDRTDRITLSSNAYLIIRDKRFALNFDNTTSTYSLRIKDLQESDTGLYQCQLVISVNEQVSQDVELQIKRPPSIGLNITKNVHVTEGSPIEMQCHADGFPIPRISWKRQFDALLPNGGVIFRGDILKITKSHRDDRGIYYCIAENGVGAEARGNVTVEIEFSPGITAVRPKVGQAQGYGIRLECRVEAHPRPVVTWFKGERELQKGELDGPGDVFVASYQVSSVSYSDFGEYVCRAENKHGKADTKVELFETVIPACLGACR